MPHRQYHVSWAMCQQPCPALQVGTFIHCRALFVQGSIGRLKCTVYGCRQLLLSPADQKPSGGGRHQAGNRNSLQQTSDSMSRSSHQNSTAITQRGANVQQAKDISTSHADAGEQDKAVPATLDSWSCLHGLEFLENLTNPENLQPLALPLELKLFTRVPVVVSARLFGQTGMPSETFARLLIM